MGESSRKMRQGECGRTRRGVLYCYLPEGVRFCPKGATSAETCRVRISGDKRRGAWRRYRVYERPTPSVL